MAALDEPIAISALQHAVYCLRQAALIHIERLWEENRFTAEGRVLHDVAHTAGERKTKGVRRVTALPLASARLNLTGVADLVEFRRDGDGETAFPVEYKRGKPKLHRADEVQLCAQALCLEEMTGRPVPEGALYYAEPKRRTAVLFDADLRRLTEDTAQAFGTLVAEGRTPPAIWRAARCRSCSLIEVCRPKATARSATEFRRRAIEALLDDDLGAGP
ncbi:CRISPR-associated protein Cas4 [Blastochloris viridis]|uniref:CRISPR-associated exonuclease Cas4 n=1 Tax=Blastochloris viridis TaxID=1079 RepID=A0A0H5BD14_BLAVI|nr:CRISPR-associated protein Cas4 [Blastochloris viridis]ALK09987.1 PD-(D/E)XK nuclease superfamily protein [Blastochloris viridis]BAS00096.1 CRISPR-associated RecB family exonuclease Cas4 [Blastochloris viridis]CUU42650.1 CRISPR-associated protein Cas4 [Blastochloris viridis]